MYVQECLIRDRTSERRKQAHDERVARGVTELTKMEKRRARAERELISTWRRVDQLRSTLGSVG